MKAVIPEKGRLRSPALCNAVHRRLQRQCGHYALVRHLSRFRRVAAHISCNWRQALKFQDCLSKVLPLSPHPPSLQVPNDAGCRWCPPAASCPGHTCDLPRKLSQLVRQFKAVGHGGVLTGAANRWAVGEKESASSEERLLRYVGPYTKTH